MAKQKLGPNQRKWLKALESGKYRQGKGALKKAAGSYCCLGVACELFKTDGMEVSVSGDRFTFDGCLTFPPTEIWKALALYGNGGEPSGGYRQDKPALYVMNDNGKRFKTIAALIRKDPTVYFKKPA